MINHVIHEMVLKQHNLLCVMVYWWPNVRQRLLLCLGQNVLEISGYGTVQRRRNKLSKFVPTSTNDVRSPQVTISLPEDFRRVSAIIDVDVVPATQRRVRLMKSGVDANKPLGFYIRDGTSIRVTPNGVEKVPAIFISRLVPGGIAESTGLLAVNDEVMEVNGIEVAGKTLDQVTDMMVANSANMIITVKPANQNNNIQRRAIGTKAPRATAALRNSPVISTSHRSAVTGETNLALVENDDEDEVKEYMQESSLGSGGDPAEAGSFPRAAWGSQNQQTDSAASANTMSIVIPQSSATDVETLMMDDASERLNGVSVAKDMSTLQHEQDENAAAGTSAGELSPPHETPTRASAYDADETVGADELNLAKNASKPSPEGGKHTSNIRVVFTPIEDL